MAGAAQTPKSCSPVQMGDTIRQGRGSTMTRASSFQEHDSQQPGPEDGLRSTFQPILTAFPGWNNEFGLCVLTSAPEMWKKPPDLLLSVSFSRRLKDGSAEGRRAGFKNNQALQSPVFKTCLVTLAYLALGMSFCSFSVHPPADRIRNKKQ